jgi:hypothetical protein
MKTKMVSLLCFLAILICLMSGQPISAEGSGETTKNQMLSNYPASLENLVVTIKGLKEGDKATITLTPELSNIPIRQLSLSAKGITQTADLSGSLKDGYYRVSISAPLEYFREPQAWDFMVSDSCLINPQSKSVVFNLIPPELQSFKPYRGQATNNMMPAPEPPSTPPLTMVELIMSISDAPKQPIQTSIRSTGYHHFHWELDSAFTGIWSRFAITDPGVRHAATAEFVLDHIYTLDWSLGSLEIGWIEASWKDSSRYGFVYDATNGWGYFNLPGSPLNVFLQSYGTNTWYASYWDGSSWVGVRSINLGYSFFDAALNGGEVYTDYATHPSLPSTTTDLTKLVSSGWVDWDSTYSATTQAINDADAYDMHTTTNYYNFYIHEH